MTKNERIARDLRISEMALFGLTQNEIADQLGLDKSTVSREMTRLRAEWQERANQNVADLVAKQAAEIEYVKRLAMVGWHKSVEKRKKSSSKKKGKIVELSGKEAEKARESGDTSGVKVIPKGVENAEVVEQGLGDPRFLMVIAKTWEREAALLGMDKPKPSKESDNPDGDKPVVSVFVLANGQEFNF